MLRGGGVRGTAYAFVTACAVVIGGQAIAKTKMQFPLSRPHAGDTYLGFSYSPAWGKIDGFTIGADDGSTAAVYPGLHDAGALLSSSFDWRHQDPRVMFGDNTYWGIEGSVGYKGRIARIELEIGHDKFYAGTSGKGNSRGSGTVYLLAKELAHDVVGGNVERLGLALAATSPQDVVAFSQTVGRTSPAIDSKVCNKRVGVRSEDNALARMMDRHKLWKPSSLVQHQLWSCIDYIGEGAQKVTTREANGRGSLSQRFFTVTGFNEQHENTSGTCWQECRVGREMRPCSSACPKRPGSAIYNSTVRRWWTGRKTNQGWPGTAEGKINTAQGMAEDLVGNLKPEEKDVVAQILTRSVSGGEVVEIQAVTTTSVMTNVCYDFKQRGLTPFACAGVGVNLISITDGHLAAKLAYKLKVGLSCEIVPRVTAFVSGFYHQVLGDNEYYDVPVQRLLDDRSPEGRSKNYAVAKFNMSYTGAEAGMRFAF